MGNKRELAGCVFGRLIVVKEVGLTSSLGYKWECKCECGQTVEISSTSLIQGATKSCGCYQKDSLKERLTKHGYTNNRIPEYGAWECMKTRCYDKNTKYYHNYGGRGVIVCDRWLGENGFINFLNDMGKKPTLKHTLDRYPDKNGNYEPTNCRWATMRQQQGNKRNNKWIEFEDRKMIQSDWARYFGIPVSTLKDKIKKDKSIEKAFNFYKIKHNK